MNDEEFEQFCAEHRDEIAELEKAVEDEIRDYSSFASARELLIVQLLENGKFEDIVVAATNFLLDSDGKILSAFRHGHQQETYILWINSM